MLFNSYVFLLTFLPLTLAAFAMLSGRHERAAVLLLVVASLVFYGWSSPWHHLVMLLASVVFNFQIGRQLSQTTGTAARRMLLAAGVGGDLALLGYFKYANFFLDQLGVGGPIDVLLPLGISFYTFTQIAYLVDAYRDEAREYDGTRYALFVTWFPHLIAGPIIHHKEMMPQFVAAFRERIRPALLMGGLSIFTVGLAKKVLLADEFAPFADAVFGNAAGVRLTFAEAWTGALAYTLQIYFDFSGYTDMAIGLSLMFGVRLPLNFNSPYKSTSIIEFWRCWHMTLSRFLRDYVYIPLGGNRRGTPRRYANLLATMLIGGLWHGAGWTFIIWGGLHGLFLTINHAWRATGITVPRLLAAVLTFVAVVVAWVFFRASDLTSAGAMLNAMAFGHGLSLPRAWAQLLPGFDSFGLSFDGTFHHNLLDPRRAVFTIAGGLAVVWLFPNTQQLFARLRPALDPFGRHQEVRDTRLSWRPTWQWGCVLGLLLAASFTRLGGESPFLYFRF